MYILKSLLLGILLFLILFPIDVSDIPRYDADEVLGLAVIQSPECELETCGWGHEGPTQVVKEDPIFTIEYIGNHKWKVIKRCEINPQWSGYWDFDEKTGRFIWNDDYYNLDI